MLSILRIVPKSCCKGFFLGSLSFWLAKIGLLMIDVCALERLPKSPVRIVSWGVDSRFWPKYVLWLLSIVSRSVENLALSYNYVTSVGWPTAHDCIVSEAMKPKTGSVDSKFPLLGFLFPVKVSWTQHRFACRTNSTFHDGRPYDCNDQCTDCWPTKGDRFTWKLSVFGWTRAAERYRTPSSTERGVCAFV